MFDQKIIFELKCTIAIIAIIISLSSITTIYFIIKNDLTTSGAIPKRRIINHQSVELNINQPSSSKQKLKRINQNKKESTNNKTEREKYNEIKKLINCFNEDLKKYDEEIIILNQMIRDFERMKIIVKKFDSDNITNIKNFVQKKRHEIIELEESVNSSFLLFFSKIKFLDSFSIFFPNGFQHLKEEVDKTMNNLQKYIKEKKKLLNDLENLVIN